MRAPNPPFGYLRPVTPQDDPPNRVVGRDNWPTFYFDGNLAWGIIDSYAEWARIKEAYDHGPAGWAEILSCQCWAPAVSGRDLPELGYLLDLPKFGYVHECNQAPTLGEWFVSHNIDPRTGEQLIPDPPVAAKPRERMPQERKP